MSYLKKLKTSFILLLLITLITGIIYPLLVTGIAQLFFPWQANGSLIKNNDIVIGSKLIGQYFSEAKYFWGRPSATSPFPYNSLASSSSNLGPSNPVLLKDIKERIMLLQNADSDKHDFIPAQLVMTSASGLDPEISPNAALYQTNRIAKARGIAEQRLIDLVNKNVQSRTMGILGEPRINVLQLNLQLDTLT